MGETAGPVPPPVAAARLRAGLAGLIAAGAALAATELVSAVGSAGPSLISSIGSRFIDRFAGSLKTLAVNLFGTNDKPTLIAGIVVVCLALGVVAGMASIRRRWVGPAAVLVLAAVGLWAGLLEPLSSGPRMVFSAIAGAIVGMSTMAVLVRRAVGPTVPEVVVTDPVTPERPGTGAADRRAFIGWSVGIGSAAAGAAALARVARSNAGVAPQRAKLAIPEASRTVPVPSAQPFDVPGLSPYVTPAADFYRIDTALIVPQVNAATWTLKISGMVDHPFKIGFDELAAMDLIEEAVTIQCVSNEVGGDLVGNAVWRGVPLTKLLERAGVQPGATQIVGRSVDDFTVGFPTANALDGRTAMVAIAMNGAPLPTAHGYPARMIVAGLYGYVSATKWLSEIQLTRLEDFDAYWVPRGWAKQAPIKIASRVDVPSKRGVVKAGATPIAGVAWAPIKGISAVEVSIDKGPWLPAKLGDAASGNTWVQWMVPWDATVGDHTITVRATDHDGVVQTAKEAAPGPDGATGYHTRKVVVV